MQLKQIYLAHEEFLIKKQEAKNKDELLKVKSDYIKKIERILLNKNEDGKSYQS